MPFRNASAQLIFLTTAYQNRLVHFYQEVSETELYEICTGELDDVAAVLAAILTWIEAHPEDLDRSL